MIYKVITASDPKFLGYFTAANININKVILLRDGARTYKFDITFMEGKYGSKFITLKNSNNSITLFKMKEL